MNIYSNLVLMVAVTIVFAGQAATTDLGVRARKTVLAPKEVKRKEDCKFQCVELACNYGTDNRTHFDDHMRKHTGDKPFKCDFCDHEAAQRSNLKTHILRKHSDFKRDASVLIPSSLLVPSPDAVVEAAETVVAVRRDSNKKFRGEFAAVILPVLLPALDAACAVVTDNVIVVADADCGDEAIDVVSG